MASERALTPCFAVAVDLVVLAIRADELCALVGRRRAAPYAGRLALPGRFVDETEDLQAAARSVLAEAIGQRRGGVHLAQLESYGRPDRDPRFRAVSVAHLAVVRESTTSSGRAATDLQWLPVVQLLERPRRLAFDHARILGDGIERARRDLEWTALATAFCPREFTVGELRRVYEIVWDVVLDPRNFHRKVTGTPGFLEPLGSTTNRQGGRPAMLYRRGPAALLAPPMTR
jgi:8-oxo-dGTP diphosphatase